ncbi:Hypoxanthine-guanine phosphoribosyltransferase [Tetrabaena socialis]|uniref:Hypoxanthine phosphoribosyltransferase n=1 Tax=Tetrabaena socialis TaxID=47790 RepID=A0A2J8A1M8_9CHLO|nr:Hypoxanthine-guanine phosphoribosyltransferase [Tetrabaena socialis]|eukprot:PNH06405.1 Hypoxanthine-guanine phosphoribosyltransferase [Tetrabaena socialis]
MEASTSGRTYHDDMARILWSPDDITARCRVLGRQIANDYKSKAPLVLGVLKGSFMFASDLVRCIEPCPRGLTLDFIRASSYGSGTESSGDVKLKTDLKKEKVQGRHVLLVEDIVDTALTITTVSRYLLEECGAASVATATLLDKHERRKLAYSPEYVGFVCPNEFVVGYGLDFDEEYRTLPYIGVLKPECYAHLGIPGPEPVGSGESGDE